jgi:cell division protein FtsB
MLRSTRGRPRSPATAREADALVKSGARPRPRLTSRAAVLAVVICAVALSLAYPVREYIAQRRQLDQLQAEHQIEAAQVSKLEAEQKRLTDPSYIEGQARARLNLCLPRETCYVVIDGRPGGGLPQPAAAKTGAWYATLWKSVQQADRQK